MSIEQRRSSELNPILPYDNLLKFYFQLTGSTEVLLHGTTAEIIAGQLSEGVYLEVSEGIKQALSDQTWVESPLKEVKDHLCVEQQRDLDLYSTANLADLENLARSNDKFTAKLVERNSISVLIVTEIATGLHVDISNPAATGEMMSKTGRGPVGRMHSVMAKLTLNSSGIKTELITESASKKRKAKIYDHCAPEKLLEVGLREFRKALSHDTNKAPPSISKYSPYMEQESLEKIRKITTLNDEEFAVHLSQLTPYQQSALVEQIFVSMEYNPYQTCKFLQESGLDRLLFGRHLSRDEWQQILTSKYLHLSDPESPNISFGDIGRSEKEYLKRNGVKGGLGFFLKAANLKPTPLENYDDPVIKKIAEFGSGTRSQLNVDPEALLRLKLEGRIASYILMDDDGDSHQFLSVRDINTTDVSLLDIARLLPLNFAPVIALLATKVATLGILKSLDSEDFARLDLDFNQIRTIEQMMPSLVKESKKAMQWRKNKEELGGAEFDTRLGKIEVNGKIYNYDPKKPSFVFDADKTIFQVSVPEYTTSYLYLVGKKTGIDRETLKENYERVLVEFEENPENYRRMINGKASAITQDPLLRVRIVVQEILKRMSDALGGEDLGKIKKFESIYYQNIRKNGGISSQNIPAKYVNIIKARANYHLTDSEWQDVYKDAYAIATRNSKLVLGAAKVLAEAGEWANIWIISNSDPQLINDTLVRLFGKRCQHASKINVIGNAKKDRDDSNYPKIIEKLDEHGLLAIIGDSEIDIRPAIDLKLIAGLLCYKNTAVSVINALSHDPYAILDGNLYRLYQKIVTALVKKIN